jgi:hypothetical protein
MSPKGATYRVVDSDPRLKHAGEMRIIARFIRHGKLYLVLRIAFLLNPFVASHHHRPFAIPWHLCTPLLRDDRFWGAK